MGSAKALAAFFPALLILLICDIHQISGSKPPPPPAPIRAVAVAAPTQTRSSRDDILTRPTIVSPARIGVEMSSTHVDFGIVPLCVAGVHVISMTLSGHSSRKRSLTVRDLSTTHHDFHAGLPDNKPLNVTKADTITLQVVVLPSRLGELSGDLHIKTTEGVLSVQMLATGVENRYRVRPIIANAVALGGKLDIRVPLFNPSSEPLAITEVFTADDFISFHVLQSNPDGVQLCSSAAGGDVQCADGHEPPETWTQLPLSVFKSRKWLLPGRQTAHILRVLARKDSLGTFRGFLHVHTSAENLIIPIQLTVVRNGVIHSPSEVVCPPVPSHTASFVAAWNTDFPETNRVDVNWIRVKAAHNMLLLSEAKVYKDESCFLVLNKIGRLVQANLVDGLSSELLEFFKPRNQQKLLVSKKLQSGCLGLVSSDLVAPSGQLDSFAAEVNELHTTVLHLLNAGEHPLAIDGAREQLSEESLVEVKSPFASLTGTSTAKTVSTTPLTLSCQTPAPTVFTARQNTQSLRSSVHVHFNHSSPLHSLLTVPVKATIVPGALLFNKKNTEISVTLPSAAGVPRIAHKNRLRSMRTSLSLLQTQQVLESWATEDRLGTIRAALLAEWATSSHLQPATASLLQQTVDLNKLRRVVATMCATQAAVQGSLLEQLTDPCLHHSMLDNKNPQPPGPGHLIHYYNGFKNALEISHFVSSDPRVLMFSAGQQGAMQSVARSSFAKPVTVVHAAYFLREGHNKSLSDMQHLLRCFPHMVFGSSCGSQNSMSTRCRKGSTDPVCLGKALLLQHAITLIALILKNTGSAIENAPCSALACTTGFTSGSVESAPTANQAAAQQHLMDLLELQWGPDFVISTQHTFVNGSVRGWRDDEQLLVPVDESLLEQCESRQLRFRFACAVIDEAQKRINHIATEPLNPIDAQHLSLLLAKVNLLCQPIDSLPDPQWPKPVWLRNANPKDGLSGEVYTVSLGVRALEDWPVDGAVSLDSQSNLFVQTNVSTFRIPLHFFSGPFRVKNAQRSASKDATAVDFLLRAHSSSETKPAGWTAQPDLVCDVGFWQRERECSGTSKDHNCLGSFSVTNKAHVCRVEATSRVQAVLALTSVSFAEQLQHVGSVAPFVRDVSALRGTEHLSKSTGPVLLSPGAVVEVEMTLFPAALLQWGFNGDSMLGGVTKQLRAGNQAQTILHDVVRLETDSGVSFVDAELSVEPFHVLASVASSDGSFSASHLVFRPTQNTMAVFVPSSAALDVEVAVHWQVAAANRSRLFRQHTWKADDAAGTTASAAVQGLVASQRCMLHSLLSWTDIFRWLPRAPSFNHTVDMHVARGHVEAFSLSIDFEVESSPICNNQPKITLGLMFFCVLIALSFFKRRPSFWSKPASGSTLPPAASQQERGSLATSDVRSTEAHVVAGPRSAPAPCAPLPRHGAGESPQCAAARVSKGTEARDPTTAANEQNQANTDIAPASDESFDNELVLSEDVMAALQVLNPSLKAEAIVQQLNAQIINSPALMSDAEKHMSPSIGESAVHSAPVSPAMTGQSEAFSVPPLPASPFGGRSEVASVHSERSGADLFSDRAIEQLLDSGGTAVPPPHTPAAFTSALQPCQDTQELSTDAEPSRQRISPYLQPSPAAAWDITQGLELPSALPSTASLGLGPLQLQAGSGERHQDASTLFDDSFTGDLGSLWGSPGQSGMGLGCSAGGAYSLAALSSDTAAIGEVEAENNE